MKREAQRTKVNHTGSSFDDLLAEDGILEEVEAAAKKRVAEWLKQQTKQVKRDPAALPAKR